MLLPAAALLVAILAFPLLFGGGSETVPPAAPGPLDEAATTRVAPAVLAKQTGIRNYERRLQALRRQNPFDQQYSKPKDEGEAQVPVEDADETSDPSVSISSSASSNAGSSTSNGSPGVSVSEPSSPSASAPAPAPAAPPPPTTDRLLTYRIDVSVGKVGEVEKRDGVRQLDPLPSPRNPVIVFLGVSENAKRASFLISTAVTKTDGDGVCLRAEDGPCEVLTMKPEDTRIFTKGPRESRYRLKLRDIVVHEQVADPDRPIAGERSE